MNNNKFQSVSDTSLDYTADYFNSRSAVYLLHGANCCPSRSARIRRTSVIAVRHEEGKLHLKGTSIDTTE